MSEEYRLDGKQPGRIVTNDWHTENLTWGQVKEIINAQVPDDCPLDSFDLRINWWSALANGIVDWFMAEE